MTLAEFLENSNKQTIEPLPEGKASTIGELYLKLIENKLPTRETITRWNDLLLEYVQQADAIFFIRRYASASNKQWDLIRRGFITEYSSGLKYVFCDNYFAHYFYLMALKNFVPTLDEFNRLIQARLFPYGFMRTSAEKPYQAYPKGKAVNINKSGWKLAHLYSVNQNDYTFNYRQQSKNLFPRGNQLDWKIQGQNNYPSRRIEGAHAEELREIAIAHFLRLVHPINYFLVPKTKLSNIDIGENPFLISFMRDVILREYENVFVAYENIIMAKQMDAGDSSGFKFNLEYGFHLKDAKPANLGSGVIKGNNQLKRSNTTNFDLSDFDLSIIQAYLIDGKSYRTIERTILKMPSESRGGGFAAKGILNSYGIEGRHKGILANNNFKELISNNSGILQQVLIKLQDYISNLPAPASVCVPAQR